MSFLLEMGLKSPQQSSDEEEEEDDDVVEVVGGSLKRERDAEEDVFVVDDDDDDVDVFGKKKKKKKSSRPTSKFSIMFDSPALPAAKAPATTANKKRSAAADKKAKNINALLEGTGEDENDVEAIKEAGKKAVQKMLSKIAASAEVGSGSGSGGKKTGRRGAGKRKGAVELQIEPSDDAEVQSLKALLVDLNSNSQPGKVRHVDIPLDDVDVELPSAFKAAPTKILTAAEREEQASKKSSSILETILGSAPEDDPPPAPAEAKIKLKTRMNGKAEWAIKISAKQTFGVTKTKFAPIYGLSAADVLSFEFDGEDLGDEDTPEGLQMEDDDMLDVRVPEDKFEAAIAYHQANQASKSKTKGKSRPAAAPAAAAAAAASPAAETNDGPIGSLTISIVVHKDASGNGEEQAFKTHIMPTTTLFKAHSGLKRVMGLYKEDAKLQYFLDSESSSALVLLPMDSTEPLTAFGVVNKAKLLVRKEAKPTLTIKVKGAGSEGPLDFEVKVGADKELRVILDAVRKFDGLSSRQRVTFTYNGVGISDESQTVEQLGIPDGGVITVK